MTEPPAARPALADPDRRRAWKAALAAPLRGRRVACALGPLPAATSMVRLLHEYGAQRPFVLASGTGAGECPGEHEATVCLVEPPRTVTMTDDLRRVDAYLRGGLPTWALDALDAYDPDRSALWVTSPFVDPAPLHGRAVLGGRPAPWVALEDKTTVDSLWEALGAARAPHRLVSVDLAALTEAHDALSPHPDAGTVWTGDARDGFNGGGEFVRWVVTPEDRAAALAFFASRCDQVRVMPFLEGVPCSIHGCVLPDGTAVLRPLELSILRGAGRSFVYGGQGTTWDPPPADRDAMRDLARRTGELLRGRVGYRGFFGIDGVLTADGFRPTELNPRMSGGVAAMAAHLDPHAFQLLQLTLVAGGDPRVTVAELEEWAVAELDASRFVKAVALGAVADDRPVAAHEIPVRWDGAALRRCAPAGAAWVIDAGPSTLGVFARLVPAAPPAGLRAAALNAALMRLLDEELGTRFGEVSPAPDVRRIDVPHLL